MVPERRRCPGDRQSLPARAHRERAPRPGQRPSAASPRCGTKAPTSTPANPNVDRLLELVERLAPELRERLMRRGADADAARAGGLPGPRLLPALLPLHPVFFELVERGQAGKSTTGRVARLPSLARRSALHFLEIPGVRLPLARRPGPPVRLGLPDPPRLRGHLPRHPRRLDAGRPPARRRVAVRLHPRQSPLRALAVPAHGRLHDAHSRRVGNRQGAGGARHRTARATSPSTARAAASARIPAPPSKR